MHTSTACDIFAGINSGAGQRFTNADLLAAMTLNQWQMLTFTFDNGKAEFYKNGKMLARATGFPMPAQWTGFQIGASDTQTVDGLVDDMRLHNRALSASEVMQLYNAGR
jgi:hypothetical protein